MLEFKKNGKLKLIDPESNLIPLLKADGWIVEGEEKAVPDIDELKAKADALGLKYHHKTGAEKLAKLIEEHE